MFKRFLPLAALLLACNAVEKINIPEQPHVPTGEVSISLATVAACAPGSSAVIVAWDLPQGTFWNARFLIERPGQGHPFPADYASGTASGKISGCSYQNGDKASAEIWTADQHLTTPAITIRP